jgi:transcriptional regulator with XRE-family HTH domain
MAKTTFADRVTPELVGQRITAAREAAGITMEQLGHALGITPQGVKGWEIGRTLPPVDRIAQVADVLAVDAAQLAFGTEG